MATHAVVARATDRGLALLARSRGKLDWTTRDGEAEVFQTVRDATRAAMRVPARFRAFALPGTPGRWGAGPA